MGREVHISRRQFFKRLIAVVVVVLGVSWVDMIKRINKSLQKKTRIVPANTVDNGVNFMDEVIIVKNQDNLKVFSAKCPHLGCTINRMEKGTIVCPCHGSAFNTEGKNLKGPAANPLNELPYRIDNNQNLIIDLS